MSIFHPFVYPEYRSPILEGSEHEEEEEEGDYDLSNRRDTARKSFGLNNYYQTPQEREGSNNLEVAGVTQFQEPSATERKKPQGSQRKSVSFGPDETITMNNTLHQRQSVQSSNKRETLDSYSITESEIQRRLEHEKQILKSKDQLLEDMRVSHVQMSQTAQKQIKINNVQMNLADIDLKKLTEEQAQDIKEIEQLQQQIEEMACNLTIGDVTNIDQMLSERPSVKKSKSSKQNLKNL